MDVNTTSPKSQSKEQPPLKVAYRIFYYNLHLSLYYLQRVRGLRCQIFGS